MTGKIHHDIDIKDLDQYTIDLIKSRATSNFVTQPNSGTFAVTIESFMTYLKNNNFKITAVQKDHSLLTKDKVRAVIKEAVHSQPSGYGHIEVIDNLMRELGF